MARFMSASRFLRWLGPRWMTEMIAAEIGCNLTQVRRWRRGVAIPDAKFSARLHRLQEETRAVEQVEMLDDRGDAMEQTAMREAKARHVRARLRRERAEAMRPVEMPVDDEAEQSQMF